MEQGNHDGEDEAQVEQWNLILIGHEVAVHPVVVRGDRIADQLVDACIENSI
jgi:hypothetical protein